MTSSVTVLQCCDMDKIGVKDKVFTKSLDNKNDAIEHTNFEFSSRPWPAALLPIVNNSTETRSKPSE